MAMTVSGMNSGSIGTLFSGLNQGSGGMSFVSDYNNIRSGAYGKLLNAYYKESGVSSQSSPKKSAAVDHTSRGYREAYLKQQEEKKASGSSSNNYLDKVKTDKAKNNQAVATSASEMVNSLDKLRSADTFKKNSAGAYDVESIQKAVTSYVDAYNGVIDKAKDSSVSGVNSNVTSIQNTTKANEKALNGIGITIGEDGKLSLDSEKFKASDMSSVKSLFDKGNYGYSVRTAAYMTDYYAKQAQNDTSTYGANGAYSMSNIMSSFSSYM